jgi:hypothetical protein
MTQPRVTMAKPSRTPWARRPRRKTTASTVPASQAKSTATRKARVSGRSSMGCRWMFRSSQREMARGTTIATPVIWSRRPMA